MTIRIIRSLLSVILVGSGQIMKQEKQKGILLLLTFYLILPTALALFLSTSDFLTRLSLYVGGPLLIGLILFSAVDAWL